MGVEKSMDHINTGSVELYGEKDNLTLFYNLALQGTVHNTLRF